MATNRELAEDYLSRFPTGWIQEAEISALEALLDMVQDSDGVPLSVENTPTVPMMVVNDIETVPNLS